MRLTLRTMLAYLDDILESSDAEQLGQKIEESKFASDLVHRIRNSTRRLRLGAPKLEGKGMGLDPNTVAEYLDNTLRPEHVPDFEKVCLESDVHLAEVASSHQILTLVLGEPADIEHAVRERVYRLDHRGNTANPESSSDAAAGAKITPRVAAGGATQAQQVQPPPDYMREGSGVRLRSLAITLVLTFLAVALGLRAMGPFNHHHILWRVMFGDENQSAQSTASAQATNRPPVEAPTSQLDRRTNESTVQPGDSDSTSSSALLAETDSPSIEDQTRILESGPSDEMASAETVPALDAQPSVTAAEFSDEVTTDVETTESAPELFLEPRESVSEERPSTEPLSEESRTIEPVLDEPLLDERIEAGPAPITKAASVGRYFSDNQVLGRLAPESGEWFSLPADAALAAGNQLIVLPSYRPQLLLSPGLKITLSGESRIGLLPPDAEGAPQLDIVYGRAIIMPVGDAGAKISVQFAARQASLQFSDMESAAAIEVRRYLPPGSDPENTEPQNVVLVYAIGGQVSWHEEHTSAELAAGQMLAYAGSDAGRILDNATLPTWFNGEELSQIEQRGSKGPSQLHHARPSTRLGVDGTHRASAPGGAGTGLSSVNDPGYL